MKRSKIEPSSAIRLNKPVIGWMILIHLLALLAPFTFSWGAFTSFVGLYYVTACLGITLGFHRLLTHHSLSVPKWLMRFLATCGTLALQGSVRRWVAHHRMHHAGADTAMDPHDANRGFWYSHLGWMLFTNAKFDAPSKLHKFARDIDGDPYLRWLSKPASILGLQLALGLALAFGGIEYLVWGIFLRLVVVYHVTWLVNSAAHLWGYRTYKIDELATNNWWVGLLAFGEGWHNNHHAQPEAVHVNHRWWELDLTWQTIRILKLAGLAKNLKMPLLLRQLPKKASLESSFEAMSKNERQAS